VRSNLSSQTSVGHLPVFLFHLEGAPDNVAQLLIGLVAQRSKTHVPRGSRQTSLQLSTSWSPVFPMIAATTWQFSYSIVTLAAFLAPVQVRRYVQRAGDDLLGTTTD